MLGKIKAVVYAPEVSPVREDTFTDAERLTEVVKRRKNFASEKTGKEGKMRQSVKEIQTCEDIWIQVHKR